MIERYGYQQHRAMIYFSNEKEAAIAIKETNKYNRWTAEVYKNISQSKMYSERTTALNTISKNIKNINHIKSKCKTTVK